MRRALVTGGTGFTGSHLVRDLAAAGWDVRVLARSRARAAEVLPSCVTVCEGDVTDADAVRRAVCGREVVFHLAALYRDASQPDERYRAVHVDGTRNVLDAALAEGVQRVVHVSTCGVHGHVEHPPADETAPFAPGDVYQRSKLEAELLALDTGARTGLPVAVARPVAIYGPGDTRLLKLFRLIAKRRFVFLGSGEARLHMVHVRDLVRALRLMAEHPAAPGEAFLVGGEECPSLNELGARIARVVGAPPPRLHLPVWPFYVAGALCEAICVPLRVQPPIYRRRVSFFTKSRAFSIEKARRLLGYRASVPLDEGLQETAAWYRAHGLIPA